jgi:DNA-binding transcriptional LysR family regulator
VARAGSVHGAAERLTVTQPAVTAALRALERDLGVRLVARAGRGLVLTAAGETLARYAARLLGLLDEARSSVREAVEPGRGRVRLVAVTTAGEHVLPAIIAEFRSIHPGVEIVLEVGNRRLTWERLRDREADVAVGGRPPSGGPFTAIAFRRNDLVIVGPGSAGAQRTRLAPGRLASRTWLLREPGSGTRATAEEWLADAGISPPTLTIGSNGAIVQSVAVGLGVTLISKDAVRREVEAGTVRILPVRGLPLRRHWHAVTRAGEDLHGAARLFLDHLTARPARAAAASARRPRSHSKG